MIRTPLAIRRAGCFFLFVLKFKVENGQFLTNRQSRTQSKVRPWGNCFKVGPWIAECCVKIHSMTIDEKKQAFNRTLFSWHKDHYRDMPWRNTRDPYHILISEIMLPQTQVDRVRTKYTDFLKRFPTVRVLAKAPLGEVLRAWSGLGYNRRARYLHDCAKKIVHEYSGKFPNDLEELKRLPGIGLSTAGALLAFSFGEDEPMIDTNIRRILVRVFFGGKRSKKIRGRTLGINSSRSDLVSFPHVPSDKGLYIFAKSLIPKGKGRIWNYAMLDLGATSCTARNHSDRCPLMRLHGEVGDFRYKKPQKKFHGSRRFYRGKILSLLTERKRVAPLQLGKAVALPTSALRDILRDLKRERLVVSSRGKIMLPK